MESPLELDDQVIPFHASDSALSLNQSNKYFMIILNQLKYLVISIW